MPTRTFESLLPRVLASAPGCPSATAAQHIKDTAIRVCERTLLWRHQPKVFTLIPGVYEYPYETPDFVDVHAVLGVQLNDSPLDVMTLEQALRAHPKWADLYSGEDPSEVWGETPTGTFNGYAFNEALFNDEPRFVVPAAVVADGGEPVTFTQLTPDKFVVLPLPDAKQPYRMRMFLALKPKRTATGMDEVAFDELEDAIVHGALQHLLTLPNTGWMDLELAAYHAKQYLFAVTERRARANLGNARATLRAQPQFFGA